MPASPTATADADQGREHPLPRRGRRRVRRQVGDRLRRDRPGSRCARSWPRRSAREPGAAFARRARDRRRHRLLLAQPAAARAGRARDRDRHLARDAGDALVRAPPSSGSRSTTVLHRGRGAAVRRRRASTSSSATPCSTTSPTSRRAFGEFERVLRPGGTVAFCGEPSRYGDRIAAVPKRAGLLAAPAWRRLVGASAAAWVERPDRATTATSSSPRSTCTRSPPIEPARARPRLAGFDGVRVARRGAGRQRLRLACCARSRRPPNRTRSRSPGGISPIRSYIALQRVDTALLEPRLPPELFYNLVLSARKPGG